MPELAALWVRVRSPVLGVRRVREDMVVEEVESGLIILFIGDLSGVIGW